MVAKTFDHMPADTPQPGAVELKNWHSFAFMPTDAKGLFGMVSVHSAKDIMGHDVNSNDSNWLAVVEGPSGIRAYIPGCQIASICYEPSGATQAKNVSPHFFAVP